MFKPDLTSLKRAAKRVHLQRISLQSGLRAALQGKPLPPGRLRVLSSSAMADQLFLIKESARLGPIFKVWWGGKFTTCIVGHELGRRFLNENEGKTRAATTDLTELFPFGFLRAMEGEPHRKYRRIFIDAFKGLSLAAQEDFVREHVRAALEELAGIDGPVSAAMIRSAFKRATTKIQFRLILGIHPDATAFPSLAAAYDAYIPNGIFLVAKDKHKEAYKRLRARVEELASEIRVSPERQSSLMGLLLEKEDEFDETVLGNLIQMTEASRYDLHGLWFWIMNMLSADPSILTQVRNAAPGQERRQLSRSIAQEALRMEQSEFIHRATTSDIVFNGYFLPKETRVRICVWEGHRDPQKFPEPFKFDAERFIRDKPSMDTYAPFGMDKHRCLGADWTIELSAVFVEELARGFDWKVVSDGPAVRGVFHFEPSDDFAADIRPLVDA